jgi:hypothetical protein
MNNQLQSSHETLFDDDQDMEDVEESIPISRVIHFVDETRQIFDKMLDDIHKSKKKHWMEQINKFLQSNTISPLIKNSPHSTPDGTMIVLVNSDACVDVGVDELKELSKKKIKTPEKVIDECRANFSTSLTNLPNLVTPKSIEEYASRANSELNIINNLKQQVNNHSFTLGHILQCAKKYCKKIK